MGMSRSCGTPLIATALLAGFHTASQAQPRPDLLAPHRAVYEIVLDKARTGGGVTNLSGRMVYELSGSACAGFSQSMRFVTRMTSQSGKTTLSDVRSSSFEEESARRFRFSSTQHRDDDPPETTSGEARRGQGGAIRVDVTSPSRKEVSLGSQTMFPVQHSVGLLAAARAGSTIYQADLYDGSEKGDKVFATTAVIGRRLEPGYNQRLPGVKNADALNGLSSWSVSLSYFDKKSEKADAVPSYELAFLFFENGVSRRVFIDYGEFSIRGELTELTFLEPKRCDKQ